MGRAPRQTDVVGRATPVSAVSELQRAYKLTAPARPQRSGGKCEKPAPLGFSHCRGVRHTHTLRVWMWLTARHTHTLRVWMWLTARHTHTLRVWMWLTARHTHTLRVWMWLTARHTHTLHVWMWLTARAKSSIATLGLANHRRLRMVAGWRHLYLWNPLYCRAEHVMNLFSGGGMYGG